MKAARQAVWARQVFSARITARLSCAVVGFSIWTMRRAMSAMSLSVLVLSATRCVLAERAVSTAYVEPPMQAMTTTPISSRIKTWDRDID